MIETDLLSKKELLQLTGISYGQLYRWKRENLIPESWFIKKSSFTGQETFFPKEKILKRIHDILNLKDRFSLGEMADIISPELTSRVFDSTDLKKLSFIRSEMVGYFEVEMKKNYFNYFEMLFIFMLSRETEKSVYSLEEIREMIISIENWAKEVKETAYRFLILLRKREKLFMLLKQDSRFLPDRYTEILRVIDLDESAKELSLLLEERKND